jgi:hypothetical protein
MRNTRSDCTALSHSCSFSAQPLRNSVERKMCHMQRISRIHLRAEIAAAFVVVFLVGTVPTPRAQAQTLTVLHSFSGGTDGNQPHAGVVVDKAGNLYGTTLNTVPTPTRRGNENCTSVRAIFWANQGPCRGSRYKSQRVFHRQMARYRPRRG